MRCSSRCASSSLPAALSCPSRSRSSSLMLGDRLDQRRARRDVVRVGVDLDELQLVGLASGKRIELLDALDLVAEQVHPPGAVLVVRREDVERVAAHPERAAREVASGAPVLQRDQVGDQLALVDPLAALERERHRRIGLDRADAVDARHRRDDDDVVALEQRARRRVAHAVDLLVDRGFLLDVGVGARDVGLRLVVVVVGDEVLDRVVGKEALELAVELRRQRLVGREDQRRALRRLDHLRHREGLAGAGDAEQHLGAVAAVARPRPGRRSPAAGRPGASKSDLITKRWPPSDFSGRGGRCGVQTLPSFWANSARPSRKQRVERALAGDAGDRPADVLRAPARRGWARRDEAFTSPRLRGVYLPVGRRGRRASVRVGWG